MSACLRTSTYSISSLLRRYLDNGKFSILKTLLHNTIMSSHDKEHSQNISDQLEKDAIGSSSPYTSKQGLSSSMVLRRVWGPREERGDSFTIIDHRQTVPSYPQARVTCQRYGGTRTLRPRASGGSKSRLTHTHAHTRIHTYPHTRTHTHPHARTRTRPVRVPVLHEAKKSSTSTINIVHWIVTKDTKRRKKHVW